MPPVAKIVPHSMTVHGDTRIDNYFWLRDRKDPDTIAYLEAENAYTKEKLQHTEGLQAALYAEMLGRIQQTDLSVPVKRDEYFYYTRTEEGKQYAIHCRKKGPGPEEILLDCNLLAESHKYFRLGAFIASPNHCLLAYSVDFEGDEKYTVRVKNIVTANCSRMRSRTHPTPSNGPPIMQPSSTQSSTKRCGPTKFSAIH